MRPRALASAALVCGLAAATAAVADAAPRAHHSGGGPSAHKAKRPNLRVHRVHRRAHRRGHVPAWVLAPGPLGAHAPGTGGSATPAPTPGTQPGTTTPPPGTPADPGGGGTPPATPKCTGTAVGATLREWSIHLSRVSVCSGSVSVQAVNYGGDPHDMWLQRTDGSGTTATFGDPSPLAAYPGSGTPPGIETQSLTLTPGTYRLFCSLVGGTPPGTPGASHDAAGMHATLTVVAP